MSDCSTALEDLKKKRIELNILFSNSDFSLIMLFLVIPLEEAALRSGLGTCSLSHWSSLISVINIFIFKFQVPDSGFMILTR